ncbi:MAG: cation:proton antiporter [bacterium]
MESVSLFAFLTGILMIGFFAQWLSWQVGMPSIVFLFAGGLIVGPLTGVLSPDALFGDLVFPVVSALIGIILFEGGLTLDLDDLGTLKGTVFRVIFLGGLITFLLTTAAAYLLFEFSLSLSFLHGGILVVTGPTVVIPLLHQVRPQGDVGSIARWEGIIIDPIGAILAVIVFEIVLSGIESPATGFGFGLLMFGESILVGGVIGILSGYLLVVCFDRYWVPDYLHNFAIIAIVLTAQAISNHILHESGLLAVTVMGMYMANQNKVTIRHILDFKEDLRVLFISILFIILVARLDRTFLFDIQLNELVFLAVLILLVRPAAITLSTLGSQLSWPERGFLAWLAPRGIVAAAVASLFAFKLEKLGVSQAAHLADITFLVIAGTVVVYGLTLSPLSLLLGLSERNPQGVLFIGAAPWVRMVARALRDEGVRVRLVDKNRDNVMRARHAGLDANVMDVTTESEIQTLNIQGIGYVLALTSNDEVNTLASIHAVDLGFNSSEIFQLPPHQKQDIPKEEQPDPLKGRPLFRRKTHFDDIRNKVGSGWRVDVIPLDSPEKIEIIESGIPEEILPLFKLTENDFVEVLSADKDVKLQEGDRLVAFRETTGSV